MGAPLLFLPTFFTTRGVEAPVGASLPLLPVVFTTLSVQGVSGAAVPHHAVPSGSPLSGALETPEPHDDDVCPLSAGGRDLRKSRVEIFGNFLKFLPPTCESQG